MTSRNRLALATAVALAGLIAVAAAFVVRETFFRPTTITAFFTVANAVYPGDEVRVSGMKIGTITSIQPGASAARLTMKIDRDVPIPADAKAVIVAPNLVAARYVQLTPAYRSTGPTMGDGAVIPVERTAIPVEWDEVKQQLMRLATDLGPTSNVSSTSVSRFIDSAANAMGGNGDKLRQTLAELSGVGRILAEGSGNIVDIIVNLQTFVTALRDSGEQMVQFQDRLATLSSVLDDSKSDYDAALKTLSVALDDIQRFIAGTRDKTSEQIQRLANVTQTLVDHKVDVENVLHVAPNAFSNGYGIYNPDTGSPIGNFVFNNFANPLQFICGSIGAIENTTAPETAKLCTDYLGPALRLLNFNNLPFAINPYLSKSASPENILYSEPGLAPGGEGPAPSPPEMAPAVSAYAGLPGDQPQAPVAAAPAPTSLPEMLLPAGTPPPAPAPTNLQQMLYPAEAPPPGNPGPVPPQAVEGTPPS
jgi:phospholipid/cholesterol/gamma-HCH transport system substrate-binding protein